MYTAQLSVEEVKAIIIKLPRKEKMKILRELERDLLPKRFNRLLNRLKDIPLTYDEINNEVEHVRAERFKKVNLSDSSCENETEEPNELQRLLLDGPIMSEEQFDRFRQFRKDFQPKPRCYDKPALPSFPQLKVKG